MLKRLIIVLGVCFVVLTALFFWERNFAVSSHRIQTQIERVTEPDETYHFSYIDPGSGERLRGKVRAGKWHRIWLGEGFWDDPGVGDTIRVRRAKEDRTEWEFGYWHSLYKFTLFGIFILGGAVLQFGWKWARGQV